MWSSDLVMDRVCATLREYVEREIIPRYDGFDAGHQRDHVETVINQSMELAQYYDVNINLVYAIAAYHDTGLVDSRERHHIVSGEIVMADESLRQWFSEEQIKVMAEAVEDHRASNSNVPRSLYGKIVAEADRLIDGVTIVRRTIQYGLAHYPQLDKKGHYDRFVEHMNEKYAEGGYLKLWIPESPNAQRLRDFQQKIKSENELRLLFEKEWQSLTAIS